MFGCYFQILSLCGGSLAPSRFQKPDYIGPELRRALEALSPADRGLVFGRVLEGLSYEELSQIYGKSAAALRKRYERARKKLAAELSQDGQAEMEVTL